MLLFCEERCSDNLMLCSAIPWYLHGTGDNREPLLDFLPLVCPNAKRTICMAEGGLGGSQAIPVLLLVFLGGLGTRCP